MREGFETKRCAFCSLDRTFNKVLFEDSHVFAWHAPVSYLRPELRYHGLVVPKRHVRFEADLTHREVLSIHKAKQFMRDMFKYQGGCSHVREGDMRHNAGTVPHLHCNIFEANGTDEVRIAVFKKRDDRIENELRAAGFATQYEAGIRE